MPGVITELCDPSAPALVDLAKSETLALPERRTPVGLAACGERLTNLHLPDFDHHRRRLVRGRGVFSYGSGMANPLPYGCHTRPYTHPDSVGQVSRNDCFYRFSCID